MKTIGLIGGISWISTAEYYKLINQGVNRQLGGLESARCIVYSFNYADIKKNNDANDWESTFRMVAEACNQLKNSGAEAIVLCANTMHLIADRLQTAVGLPVIHVATVTAKAVEQQKMRQVGLLGTKFTMELNFFDQKLTERGIEVLIPDPADRSYMHDTIFDELGKGIINQSTQRRYIQIIDKLVARGAEGIILGCTELPLIIHSKDLPVPCFDTTLIHAEAAVIFMLESME